MPVTSREFTAEPMHLCLCLSHLLLCVKLAAGQLLHSGDQCILGALSILSLLQAFVKKCSQNI